MQQCSSHALCCAREVRVIPSCLHSCALSRAPRHLGTPSAAKQLYNCLALSCGTRGFWGRIAAAKLHSTLGTFAVAAVEVKTPALVVKESQLGCLPWSGQQRDCAEGWQTNSQACTEMLCWCASAPAQLYSQGVNTELWRCSQAPRQARTCPGLSIHLPTGWMWPLHCQNRAKTPGNPGFLF